MIIGDPATDKTPELLRAYGRFLESLGGRYVTACDVGTSVADMDVIDETCRFVTGRSPERGGAGDSSVLTAFGVFQGMRAAAQLRWGRPVAGRPAGRRRGVGKVGSHLVGHLLDDGAAVVVSDADPATVARVLAAHPGARAVADSDALVAEPLDVYAPCALGGALDDEVVAALTAERRLRRREQPAGARPGGARCWPTAAILYAPDFLVNAGGVIQVADELHGFDLDRARRPAAGISAPRWRCSTAAGTTGCCRRPPPTGSPRSGWPRAPGPGTLYPGLAATAAGRHRRRRVLVTGPRTCTLGATSTERSPSVGRKVTPTGAA